MSRFEGGGEMESCGRGVMVRGVRDGLTCARLRLLLGQSAGRIVS